MRQRNASEQDELLIKKEQRNLADQARDFNSFEEGFKVAVAKRAKAVSKSKARAGRAHGKHCQPTRHLDNAGLSMASQSESMQCVPEGGFLLKARPTSCWCKRLFQFKSHSGRSPTRWIGSFARLGRAGVLLRGAPLAEAPIRGSDADIHVCRIVPCKETSASDQAAPLPPLSRFCAAWGVQLCLI